MYRALLEQCPRLESLVDTLPGQTNQIQHLVRKQFRRNRHETSHRLVVVALHKGYEAEELLRTAGDGDNSALSKVKDILTKVHIERERGREASRQELPSKPRAKPNMRSFPGHESTILKRPLPFEALGGIRQVPKLTSSNSLPFLRFKRPQPDFLSRVFRNKINQRQRRNNNLMKMDEDYKWAANEEQWDRIVANEANKVHKEMSTWRQPLANARAAIEEQLDEEHHKVEKMSRKLLRITNQEEDLRVKEKQERKMAKNKDRQERKGASGADPRGSLIARTDKYSPHVERRLTRELSEHQTAPLEASIRVKQRKGVISAEKSRPQVIRRVKPVQKAPLWRSKP